MNRPKRLNALCEQLIDELLTALEEYDKNENIKVIVITGSDRVFSG
ncbi:unnamed protein product [Anisakis simplex]|uniref:Enoyl-CoA hydratase/isomerase family protein n=1 Tax=Anisakis simplex TaxID=6269 RepID=A0A3P6Q3J2_ANISI|nr:unnamed protein product [Anisakis simplex]